MAHERGIMAGTLAALGTCIIAAGWQIVTRNGVTKGLHPLDLVVLRYAVPALILLPWIISGKLPLKASGWRQTAALVMGGGAPFGFIVMSGSVFAPVAHMGALLPGAMPFMVAVVAALMLGERYDRWRKAGFATIAAGVILIAGPALAEGGHATLIGDALFLCGALFWAVYTVMVRRSGLSPLELTAIVSFWSALLAFGMWLIVPGGRLWGAAFSDIAWQLVWQGLVGGFAGTWLFGVAVARLGPAPVAATAALVPALSAIGGWIFLAETVSATAFAGIVTVIAGIILASGLLVRVVRAQ
ncbi:MAG: DMT family transporter [Beijerinckiaceae bacterium]